MKYYEVRKAQAELNQKEIDRFGFDETFDSYLEKALKRSIIVDKFLTMDEAKEFFTSQKKAIKPATNIVEFIYIIENEYDDKGNQKGGGIIWELFKKEI